MTIYVHARLHMLITEIHKREKFSRTPVKALTQMLFSDDYFHLGGWIIINIYMFNMSLLYVWHLNVRPDILVFTNMKFLYEC